jgi:hypothetical protein
MATEKPPGDELAAKRKATRRPQKRKSGKPATHPDMILAKQRQHDALTLKMAGASLQRIADEVGYAGPSGADYAIKAALRDLYPDSVRQEYARMEQARIDRLMLANWTAAMAGNIKAGTLCSRLIDQRIRLLGIAEPTQVQVSVRDGDELHLGVMDVLDDKTMTQAILLRERMRELQERRAGAIEIEPSTAV